MADETPVPSQLGNYDIVSKIAEGGMGTVYRGRNRSTGEAVAVKVIAPATAKNPVLLQRFEREFLAAKVLDHRNVVRALDYSGAMPHPFLVMEFVDGQSIGQRLEKQGRYPEDEAVRLISQVCDGLQHAHKQGLVHRDVKPDNILVTRDGVAKLTDMGLVREVEGDLNLTRTGRGLGTPHFMAPEQFRNAKTVDARGDIYSLGATLYAMVTGTIPFDNASPLDCWMRKIRNEFRSPKELNPAVSDRVDWAIRRAMSAEPSQRPASCREFLEDLLGKARGSGPVPSTPAGAQPSTAADVWYLVYLDETNKKHTVKGSTDGIRNALRDRLLGDPGAVLVSRTKHGQFTPLSSVPEFRDLVVTPAAVSGPPVRPADPNATVDYRDPDAVPAGSAPHRVPPAPPSGRLGPRAAPPPAEPQYDEPGGYHPPPRQPRPARGPRPPAKPAARGPRTRGDEEYDEIPRETPRGGRRAAEPGFNWTPVLVVVVVILTAVVGYLVLAR